MEPIEVTVPPGTAINRQTYGETMHGAAYTFPNRWGAVVLREARGPFTVGLTRPSALIWGARAAFGGTRDVLPAALETLFMDNGCAEYASAEELEGALAAVWGLPEWDGPMPPEPEDD